MILSNMVVTISNNKESLAMNWTLQSIMKEDAISLDCNIHSCFFLCSMGTGGIQ